MTPTPSPTPTPTPSLVKTSLMKYEERTSISKTKTKSIFRVTCLSMGKAIGVAWFGGKVVFWVRSLTDDRHGDVTYAALLLSTPSRLHLLPNVAM